MPNGKELKINRFAGEALPLLDSQVYLSWAAEDAFVMETHAREVFIVNHINPGENP